MDLRALAMMKGYYAEGSEDGEGATSGGKKRRLSKCGHDGNPRHGGSACAVGPERGEPTASEWRASIEDKLECNVCGLTVPAPVRACVGGHVVCDKCVPKDCVSQCTVEHCGENVHPDSRCFPLEKMAQLRLWPCHGRTGKRECPVLCQYHDIASHRETCRHVIKYQCPIKGCGHKLKYNSKDVLAHMETQHNFSPKLTRKVQQRLRVKFPLRPLTVLGDFSEGVCTYYLYKVDVCFVMIGIVESLSKIGFRAFYFSDDDDISVVCMHKHFKLDEHSFIDNCEEVQRMSDLQFRHHLTRELPLYEDMFALNKSDFLASCFKTNESTRAVILEFDAVFQVHRLSTPPLP